MARLVLNESRSDHSRALRRGLGSAAILCGIVAAGFMTILAPRESRGLRFAHLPTIIALDSRGRKFTLTTPPRRIVSLSPGTTEMLFALGLKGRIVADTAYCDYPPEAKTLPKIGDVETSIERVAAQRPDLIVADAVANRRAIEPLERLKLPVFTVPQSTLEDTSRALILLGNVTGQNAQAATAVSRIKGRTDRIRGLISRDSVHPRVLCIVQVEPLMVVGAGNFMDDLITLAGGVNVGRAAGIGWAPYSPEKVVAVRPDVILTSRSSVDSIRNRSGWSSVPAISGNRVHYLTHSAARPGPRAVDALEELAHLLHPSVASGSR